MGDRGPGGGASSADDASSDDVRRLIEAAAVLGPDAVVPFALGIAGIDAADADRAVEAVAASGTLLVQPGCAGPRLAFAHETDRLDVIDDIEPRRRYELHRRAAALFDDEPRMVAHLSAATPAADDALADRARRLADVASEAGRWAHVAEWLLTAARLSSRAAPRERDMLGAVEALVVAGDVVAAAGVLEELGVDSTDAAHDLLAGRLAALRGDLAGGERRLRAAWDAPDGDDRVASLAASHLAALSFAQADGDEAVVWATRALGRATPAASGRDVDPASRLLLAYGLAGRVDEGFEVAERFGIDLDRPPDRSVAPPPGAALGVGGLCLASGDATTAERWLRPVADEARRSGPFHLWCYAQGWRAMAAAQLGRWDEALGHADDATHAAGSAPAFAAIGWAVATVVHVGRGSDAAGASARAELARAVAAAGSPRLLASIVAAVEAWAAETSGDHDGVLAALDPWDHGDLTAATRTLVPAVATMRARALARLGRPDDATAALVVAPSPIGPVEGAWRAATGGLVAATRADLATARRLLADAEALAEGSGHQLDAARIALAHGSVLRRAGKRREARHHLTAAALVFDHLDARPFRSQCEAELATSGRSPRRRDADPAGLTPAEQAVADLVVAGRRNREVAAELFVSPKTVEFHLGNVYRKLGVSNRTQLAARLGGATTS